MLPDLSVLPIALPRAVMPYVPRVLRLASVASDDYAGAQAALQATLGIEGVLLLQQLGLQRAAEGRSEEAIGLLKTALAMLAPGIGQASVQVVLGRTLAHFGLHEQALAVFDVARADVSTANASSASAFASPHAASHALLATLVEPPQNASSADYTHINIIAGQNEIDILHLQLCAAQALSLCALGRAQSALTMLETGLPHALCASDSEALSPARSLFQQLSVLDFQADTTAIDVGLRDAWLNFALARVRVLLALHRPVDAIALLDALPPLEEAAYRQDARSLNIGDAACLSLCASESLAEAHLLRAAALLTLNRPMLAIAPLEARLAACGEDPAAFVLYGQALTSLGEPAFAVDRFEQALRIAPAFAPAYRYMASALVMQKLDQEALSCLRAARRIKPDWPEAWLDEAGIRLRRGELARGFAAYEWREGARHAASHGAAFWNGDDSLTGQSILILGEQGLGDTLQFIRYLPTIVAQAREVTVEVSEKLQSLLSDFGRRAGFRVITPADPRPSCERFTLLMSLPHAVNTRLETIPAAVPYLGMDVLDAVRFLKTDKISQTPLARASTKVAGGYLPEDQYGSGGEHLNLHVNSYRDQHGNAYGDLTLESGVAQRPRYRVGIVPAGNPAFANDAMRSMPLSAFAPLLARDDIDAVLLQAEPREADRRWADAHPEWITQIPLDGDFSETAKVIAELDLVISVDTALAHLTGAMAMPVWILLPYIADWRWLEDRSDSPWYPSARLFRQLAPRDWESVVAQICFAVDAF